MKRLIKLLSIFGVLIILGSCSSSKSVNVTDNITDDGFIYILFEQTSTDNDGYTYTLNSDVVITDNVTKKTIERGYTSQIKDFFIAGHSYTYYWTYTSTKPTATGWYQLTKTLYDGDKSRRIKFLEDDIKISSN